MAIAEEAAVDIVADMVTWLRVHGLDVDAVFDRAEMHCRAEFGT
ncbi:hypothetical protein [Streptomyces sp. NPDC005805]